MTSPAVRSRLEQAHAALLRWGIDGTTTVARLRGSSRLGEERREYERQRLQSARPGDFPQGPAYAVHGERDVEAGQASGHYFHQDLLVAREIFARQPRRHIDVGSSIYGFVSHVASFREVEVLDVRPVSSQVPGITFVQQDVMALGEQWSGVADSVSCLHALEHFGLGRYGDRVDYDGWRRGLEGLGALLSPGGMLYLSVPTGEVQRVEFNAHRVFSLPFLHELLSADYAVERLAFVTDAGDLVDHVDPAGADAQRGFGASYGCSIWVLRKPA